MNPRHTQEQIGLFPVAAAPSAAQVDALRAEAAAARDAALAGLVRRTFTGIGRFLATLGTTLLEFPERRATFERLRSLSDRELADIGLSRSDLARVFDPDFQVPARPANANVRPLPSGRPRVA
jgi:uncharacterized protein YjiS (DUF1127 family)